MSLVNIPIKQLRVLHSSQLKFIITENIKKIGDSEIPIHNFFTITVYTHNDRPEEKLKPQKLF